MHLVIILPAHNEASVIRSVIHGIPRSLTGIDQSTNLVIDDGSLDDTATVAREAGAQVFRHRLNRGVGVATMTGLAAARRLKADIVVTIDSDGQHDPADIRRVIQPILDDAADVVIGARPLTDHHMPFIRRVGNRLLTGMIRLIWRIPTRDSQSGFRAYNQRALAVLAPSLGGYEVCTELLITARQHGLKMVDIPIKVIYTEYSQRKGQSTLNGLTLVARFLHSFFYQ